MHRLTVPGIALLLCGCAGTLPSDISPRTYPQFSHSDVIEAESAELRERIFFATDSAVITGSEAIKLDRLRRLFDGAQLNRIDIVGHTDSNHSDAYNQSLGMRRARAVFDYLGLRTALNSRVYMTSAGERHPRTSNTTAAGLQQNRRVEISARLLRYPLPSQGDMQ
ncbi:MAG: OmpA family protein [Pontibacterium sp.]